MKKEHNYVKCQGCDWRITQDDYDPSEETCARCKNTRFVIDPTEILCNLCGECMCPLGTHNEQYPHGLHEAQVTGGYDSYHLLDCSTYEFSFCEKCLRKLFMECKIKPTIYETNPMTGWAEDQSCYEYRLWKDNGGHHEAYINRKCNRIKDCQNDAIYTRFVNDDFTEDCCCEEHKLDIKYSRSYKYVPFISNNLKVFL